VIVKLHAWLDDAPRQRVGMAVFQRCIGLAILFRVATEYPFAPYLWGPGSFSTVKWGNGLDALFASDAAVRLMMIALGISASLLVVQLWTRLATIATFVLFTLLMFRTPELGDGGDNIAQLALLYMMALLPAAAAGRPGSIRVWVHNLAAAAVCVQVCIVYFVAGFAKAHGDAWQNGTALYLISQVEWFSQPATKPFFANAMIATLGAYATVVFQLWFPVAVFSRLKPVFVVLALGFHVGIAVSMGLLTFSLIMAGGDLSLITDDEYARMRAWLLDRRRRVALGWARNWAAEATLYLDGDCAVCRRSGVLVTRLDVARRLRIVSFRSDDSFAAHGIAVRDLERRMHMVIHAAPPQVRSGFDVVAVLVCRLPALWLAVPAVAVLRSIGAGDRVYDAIAARRYGIGRIVHCHNACHSGSATE
jgi:predicted DCC family thiol-disulfide oxidoreductase YuxK